MISDYEEFHRKRDHQHANALSILSSLQTQWDIVLRSGPGFTVTLELSDHFDTFVQTGINAHVILEGKKFPDDMVRLMQKAKEWSEQKNKELTEFLKNSNP